jgi:hypothetical protein
MAMHISFISASGVPFPQKPDCNFTSIACGLKASSYSLLGATVAQYLYSPKAVLKDPIRWCSHQSKRVSPLRSWTHDTYVKRVSQRSTESHGFLRVPRFPPTGNVDRVGWPQTDPSSVIRHES